ncbi:MAG: hypothetical protein IPP39_12935 [Chitinophagaceae bacterium]|nr:hypothetical protein [Chitinophagaceae bacterium]
MLFLAVFCGFLAEYQLEHKIEKDREKQFIKSLVEDLKEDEVVIQQNISINRTRVAQMDSFLPSSATPTSLSKTVIIFIMHGKDGPRISMLSTNNKTFDQLKIPAAFA